MASEIRVDKINSLSGVGTVTLSPTGVDIAGITTAATLRATTGIVTSLTAVSSAKVGSGVTLSPDGDIFATGVTTSTTFVGALTGNVTGNISGGTVAGSTGTFTGNVAVSGANITLQDSGSSSDDRIILGAGSDLNIFHDGSNSFITNTSSGGYLHIRSGSGINLQDDTGDENFIKCIDNGAVEIYHNNVKKLSTDSNGVKINSSSLYIDSDNEFVAVGAGDDLKIFHDGTNTNIRNQTGQLYIRSTDVRITNDGVTEHMAKFIENGAVELYHNNIKKLQTSTTDGVILGNTTDDANYTNTLTLTRRGYENSGYGVRIQAKGGSAAGQNGLRFAISDGTGSNYTSRFSFTNDGLLFNSDTATANALDDFEEGTFTATITSGGTVSSFTHNKCSYIKIGHQVIFQMYLQFTGSANGSIFKVGNLPFASRNYSTYGFGGASIVYQNNSFQATDVGGHVQNLGTDINFYKGDGNVMPGNGGNLFGGADFILIGQYQAG